MNNSKLITKNLIGRPYWQAPILASRVDCKNSVAHNLAAAKAIESACGIEISSQTKKLRELILAASIIQNHTKDLYFNILPAMIETDSVFELNDKHKAIFEDAVLLQKFADQILISFTGRLIHPITSVAGGFKFGDGDVSPQREASPWHKILEPSIQIIEAADRTLRLFTSLNTAGDISPQREVSPKPDYAALHLTDDYAFYDGEIWTEGGKVYSDVNLNEFAHLLSFPRRRESRKNRMDPRASLSSRIAEPEDDKEISNNILAGPLARYNLSQSHFDKQMRKKLTEFGIGTRLENPFGLTMAKIIENYYFVILSIKILNHFVEGGIEDEHIIPPRLSVANGTLSVPPKKFSSGISACESADGTVVHSCELDKDGIIVKYEIFTPTDIPY